MRALWLLCLCLFFLHIHSEHVLNSMTFKGLSQDTKQKDLRAEGWGGDKWKVRIPPLLLLSVCVSSALWWRLEIQGRCVSFLNFVLSGVRWWVGPLSLIVCFTNVGKELKSQAETLENSPYQNVSDICVSEQEKLCDGNFSSCYFCAVIQKRHLPKWR